MVGRKYGNDDYNEVSGWYEARGLHLIPSLLPKTGFIVPGVAAGFLMLTDTSCAILEPFIANPRATREDRDEALKCVMKVLDETAKSLGVTHLYGFSSNENMLHRSLAQGFQIAEASITVVKELN